jgi:cell pole-organizing protein PopZ
MADINQDPSMEEILASIKRVIAEDGRAALASSRGRNGGQRPEPEAQANQEPDDDVLELSDPVSDEDRLISEGSAAASRQSLAVLAAMRQQNEASAPSPVGDGPLEAVVRDMLRPILKEWLDERLPEIVEDMVAREIARITGKSF